MDGVAISLGLLVGGVVVVFIGWPWWGPPKTPQAELGSSGRSAGDAPANTPEGTRILTERREAVLNALRDLDFDHAVGKVTAEDYGPLRQTLLVEVAEITAKLDDERVAAETELDKYIEVNRSSVHPPPPASNGTCPACGQAVRSGAFYCTTCGTRLHATCPQCGQIVQPADLFCSSCGTEVSLVSAY